MDEGERDSEMKVGDKLHDNDPRMSGRVLLITCMGVTSTEGAKRVQAKTRYLREVWISTKRIHSDGKPRKSGFALEVVN
jgi:hypothetical protein